MKKHTKLLQKESPPLSLPNQKLSLNNLAPPEKAPNSVRQGSQTALHAQRPAKLMKKYHPVIDLAQFDVNTKKNFMLGKRPDDCPPVVKCRPRAAESEKSSAITSEKGEKKNDGKVNRRLMIENPSVPFNTNSFLILAK